MDLLSNEILSDIFILLPIIQKQQCTLVCRKWTSLIRNHLLLHTIVIDSIPDAFKKFILMIKEQPHLGLQVINLTLNGSIPENFDRKELLVFFPNVKVLIIGKKSNAKLLQEELKRERPLGNSNEYQLKHVEEWSTFDLTKLILTSPSPYLVQLTLLFTIKSQADGIFPLLKNAPSLKELAISYYTFTMDLYDTIHTNTPSLESLKLLKQSWFLPAVEMPIVTSVTSLKKLVIKSPVFEADCLHKWLYYFEKKHPNIEYLDFPIEHRQFLDSDVMLKCMQDCPNMFRRFKLKIKNCYRHVFMSSLNIADQCEYQIKELCFDKPLLETLRLLPQSNQSSFIDNLIIQDISTQKFDWISGLSSLKSFSISNSAYFSRRMIDLKIWHTDLAKLCRSFPPTMESITVPDTFIHEDMNYDQQFPMIKKLAILGSQVYFDDICYFISTCLPNLNTLCVDVKACITSQLPTFLLPNHHFSVIEVYLYASSPTIVKLVTSEKTRFYCLRYRTTDYALLGDTLPAMPEPTTMNYVTIICASVKSLTLRGYPTHL